MKRSLGVLAIALSLLGCSAHASISASAGSKGAQTAGAEALKPRESDWDKESREEAEIAARSGTPAHESGAAESPSETAASEPAIAPPAKARRGKKHSRGKAKKNQDSGAEIASSETGSDHDRGHGNDLDGVDEDNPGKSKKK